MNYKKKFLIPFLISLFFFNLLSADVISLNAGGSTNLSVSSDRYIEGFFFGIPERVISICGNGIVETGEQCDDGNTISGDGCSSACQVEGGVIPSPPGGVIPPGIIPTISNISVNPRELNINLIINTTTERIIRVTNNGTTNITVGVSQLNLENHVIFGNTSLVIPAGETVDLKVIFVALSEPGIFTGKIVIGGVSILVSLNVKTEFLLFDSNIVVLNKDYKVRQGEQLRTLVTIIPLGDPQRLDVTLNFVIKDYSNKIYFTKTETLLVERQIDLRRNFDTGLLPLGDYVVGLELIYPRGVAPSSAHFKVIPAVSFFGRVIFYLIIMILVILIIIVVLLILKKKRKQKEETYMSKNELSESGNRY